MARPRATAGPDSRARLLVAATADFAAHGYAGASVDRIARKARLNKAMIYYHFGSKDGLYGEIIREATTAVAGSVERALQSATTPDARLAAFVKAFAEEAVRRPEFPRLLMREMAEQGRHMDPETAKAWVAVPALFFRIFQEGVACGRFHALNPLVAYVAVIGPVVLLLLSAPARRRVGRIAREPLPDIDPRDLSAQVQRLALGLLCQPEASARARKNGDRHESRLLPSRARRQPARGDQPRRRLP